MTSLKRSPYGEAPDFGDEIGWEPRRLVFPGPWAGHLPFARWLVQACRPDVLVELGTHTGNSFSTFCQAIQESGAPTRAFAVDIWTGDDHAGYYGDDVYEELKAFTDASYPEFATLLRTTFDEAVSQFMPGTVDILHIDGMHTYEAVKHDFLTWHDMLSDRAVVLFHDTNVHERGFGVWKLWEELSVRHPSFEFRHSNGLGVLGVGSDLPDAMKAFFASVKDEDVARDVAALFAARGKPLELRTDLIASHRELSKLHKELDEAKDYQRQLEETLAVLSPEKEQADRALAEQGQALERVMGERDHLANVVHDIFSSTSWRMTGPLRLAGRLYRSHCDSYVKSFGRRWGAGKKADVAGSPPDPAADSASLLDAARGMMRSRLDAFLSSDSILNLPSAPQPDVSIILVLHNQAEMTYACLAAIRECLENSAVRIETILLDNGSDDRTHALLERIEGARIIRNDQNLHFPRGVNAAADHAGGRHILLLDNDVQITQGSLETAARLLDTDPSIGAVGARIILPDGTLQEAGAIIRADGSRSGYGHGRNPEDAEFMFRRDVDYCSGAFLMTPRTLFERLGRYDETCAPACHEDADYCVRVWKENLRVVYEPGIVVHHFEFADSGKDSGALRLRERNQGLFRDRHAGWLAQQSTAQDSPYLARHHRPHKPRILFIADQVPEEWPGAGFSRTFDIVQEFVRQGLQVTLFPTAGRPENRHEIWKAVPATVEIVLPREEGADLRRLLAERKGFFDGIFVTRPHNMQKLRAVLDKEPELKGQARLIYDAEALFANREIAKKKLDGVPLSKQAQEK
ncbi:MAG: class I SAM-dependent methyltransferase, partial [Agrobacterium sp.]|nr:class I SAM-dependent methyltransferase [Agrobacterium sp.]